MAVDLKTLNEVFDKLVGRMESYFQWIVELDNFSL